MASWPQRAALISIELDAEALGRVRVTPSPVLETMIWLRMAVTGARHPVYGGPDRSVRTALDDPDVALVARFVRHHRLDELGDALVPPPMRGAWAELFDAQLERLRAAGAGRIAGGLRRFWTAALGPRHESWEALVSADVARRAGAMAEAGVGGVLGSLHPDITWTGREIRVAAADDATVVLRGRPLVLIPSALTWPGPRVRVPAEGAAFVGYPVGPGPDAGCRADPASLSALIGPARAAILRDLYASRTTTVLSARHRLAPSTVSHHLRVLHDAGLVARRRHGVEVAYERTSRGDAVVGDGVSSDVE